jgi:hypothetical protein
MSESETDQNEKPKPDLSGDQFKPKKEMEWLPLAINMSIFGIYSLVLLAGSFFDEHGNTTGNYGILIILHVISSLVIFVIYIFINIAKAAQFFLSAVLILLIGFSVCGGLEKITNGSRDKRRVKEREMNNEKAKADSIASKLLQDSANKAFIKDSIENSLK